MAMAYASCHWPNEIDSPNEADLCYHWPYSEDFVGRAVDSYVGGTVMKSQGSMTAGPVILI